MEIYQSCRESFASFLNSFAPASNSLPWCRHGHCEMGTQSPFLSSVCPGGQLQPSTHLRLHVSCSEMSAHECEQKSPHVWNVWPAGHWTPGQNITRFPNCWGRRHKRRFDFVPHSRTSRRQLRGTLWEAHSWAYEAKIGQKHELGSVSQEHMSNKQFL